jgi:hypothetical protein
MTLNVLAKEIRNTTVYLGLASLLLIALASPASNASPASAQASGRYFPQTGKTLAPEFLAYYDSRGGVPIFGYPLTDAETEGGFKVQYLERARIEHHPEHRGTAHEVQLGLLGNIVTAGRHFGPAPNAVRANAPGRTYFPQTNHTLSGAFLDYWQRNGGLALFGYPISEPVDENGVLAQYFERNRFELHPENAGTPYEVLLGLLGRDVLNARVHIKESTVTLPVYAYEQAFYTPEGDAINPYPRLDMSRVGPAQPRTYRLIVLENRYLKLSVLPQLGGRLYEAIYKPTGHNELYRNPVIKPAPFGARGWWLGAGGTEWAAPTDEHGLMEYLPWDASVARDSNGGAAVTVSATDRLTGMKVSVEIALAAEESAYSVSPRIENRTGSQQRGHLWTNAMLAPGGTNRLSPRTQVVVPTNQMVVHSTSDPGIPGERTPISWPLHNDRDLSDLSTWRGWFGAFALPQPGRGSFAAIYNPDADEGMVKTFQGASLPGLKIFAFGPGFNTRTYTDDESGYAELWGGLTPTFWESALFPQGSGMGWTERWQPVASTGGVGLANAWGTVSANANAISSGTTVTVLPTRRTEGATLVARGPQGETRHAINAYPDRPASVVLAVPVDKVEVLGQDGRTLLKGAPLYR